MNLKEIILSSQPELSCDIFPHVRMRAGNDTSAIKGALGEAYVSFWLSRVSDFEKKYNSLDLVERPNYVYSDSDHGVLVKRDNRPYSEVDGLCRIAGVNFGIEVKSNKIGNILYKLQRKMKISSEVLGDENCKFALFFPYSSNDRSDILAIEDKFGEKVSCIDLGYRRSDLSSLVKDYKKLKF